MMIKGNGLLFFFLSGKVNFIITEGRYKQPNNDSSKVNKRLQNGQETCDKPWKSLEVQDEWNGNKTTIRKPVEPESASAQVANQMTLKHESVAMNLYCSAAMNL